MGTRRRKQEVTCQVVRDPIDINLCLTLVQGTSLRSCLLPPHSPSPTVLSAAHSHSRWWASAPPSLDYWPRGIGMRMAMAPQMAWRCHPRSAIDKRSGEKVAIKKLSRPFQSEIFAKRAYRELLLLKHMQHENVIGLLDVFTPASSLRNFHDFYLVMPFMQTDLQKIMGMEFSEDKIQYLVYQMLKGLKYIHSAGVIHRDLKPGNLAVNEDCELKILDFGLARHTDVEMTGYVVTRWYRAPEVILSWMRYNQTVDIWSVGCIMAEMLTGKTLFKGKDYLDQLTQILKVTGVPGAEFVQKLNDKAAKSYIQSLPQSPKKDFSQLFPRASPQATDLLEKMLELDVDKRLTASQALAHPFFEPFRDPEEETEAQQPLEDSLEREKLTVDEWKQHIYKEIVNFSPIARKDSRRRSGMKLQ